MQLSVAIIGQMIEQSKQMGGNPREIHMHPSTLKLIAGAIVPAKDNRSPLQRMMGAQVPQDLIAQGFYGLPIVQSDKFPVGMIALRDEKGMGRDDWFEDAMQHQGGRVPWLERVKQEPPAESAPTPESVNLDDLSTSPDHVTASDVLIKSFDGIDRVKDVVVLRCMRNGTMEMSCTFTDGLETMRALQLAMAYLMHG